MKKKKKKKKIKRRIPIELVMTLRTKHSVKPSKKVYKRKKKIKTEEEL